MTKKEKEEKVKQVILSSFDDAKTVIDGLLKQMEDRKSSKLVDAFTLYVIKRQVEDILATQIVDDAEVTAFNQLTEWFEEQVKKGKKSE
jgi:hypothetical protein